jgi:hypothetical protein
LARSGGAPAADTTAVTASTTITMNRRCFFIVSSLR